MSVDPPEVLVPRRGDVTVKINAEVAAVAKIVAAYRGISLAEYLSVTLEPVVNADLGREQERRKPKSPPKKP